MSWPLTYFSVSCKVVLLHDLLRVCTLVLFIYLALELWDPLVPDHQHRHIADSSKCINYHRAMAWHETDNTVAVLNCNLNFNSVVSIVCLVQRCCQLNEVNM